MRAILLCLVFVVGCCPQPPSATGGDASSTVRGRVLPREIHLDNLRQLTFGGENAEAYWSFDGRQLVFQASPPGKDCDQIYRMALDEKRPEPVRVSNGLGATTCAYFLPGDRHIVYSSTHLGGAACPPEPDRSQGYVWPLYPSYDIFRAELDGKNVARLTDTPGYDAEATVCPIDGSIVFTSVRDGDLELYRMDADGKNVKRLTQAPGYDGGAFFDRTCRQIVWRASRPDGRALEDYRRLLKQNLVRPTKLEIWVANADGSDARQVTYLDAASFAPYWFPSSDRIVFSSNYGDPRGREFDLWAIDDDGTDLERITFAKGFDGFPMFSPDGKLLAFASNRATAPGAHDTNVFVARWIDKQPVHRVETAADRVMRDIVWLADPARQGRGLGTPGLAEAGAYVEKRLRAVGVAGGLADGGMRQTFRVPVRVNVGEKTRLSIDGRPLDADAFQPFGASAQGRAEGRLVFAGYGIHDAGREDYAGLDVRGKVVLVRRFAPDSIASERDKRRLSDLRHKAWVARERGARALLVVDAPERGPAGEQAPEEAPFPPLIAQGYSDAGIPVVMLRRAAGEKLIQRIAGGARPRVELEVALDVVEEQAFNVVGKLAATAPKPLRGAIVIGAHYDHLGLGGPGSLAPDERAPHLGADDNASGVAALIETARLLARQKERARDIYLIAFSAEERGVLGSSHFVKNLPGGLAAADLFAMLNMDMVGRLRNNRLQILGGDSAAEWPQIVQPACAEARVSCSAAGDGYGPSDQTPFFAAGVPVLHFFTGAHSDYHKPSDSADAINAAGVGQVAQVVSHTAQALASRIEPLTLQPGSAPAPLGDLRSSGASLGTIPDYGGPPAGQRGVLLSGVRKGGAAELGGMRRGDILVKLSSHDIGDVRDLMYALSALEPGQTVTAVVIRDGKRLNLQVTLQKRARAH